MTAPTSPIAIASLEAFVLRWHLNQKGGWSARFLRHRALIARLLRRARFSVPLFWGASMDVVAGERVSNGIAAFGYSEDAITALYCHLIAPGDRVIDAGTHFGYEALLAAHLVGSSGRVWAFEPNPAAYRLATANLAEYSAAIVLPFALSSVDDFVDFEQPNLAESAFARISDSLSPSSGTGLNVELRRIDSLLPLFRDRVAVIKCDVEEHEEDLLHGAYALIERDHPAIILEAGLPSESGDPHPRARILGEILLPFGYASYDFEFDGLLHIAPLGTLHCGHANVLYLPTGHPLRAFTS